jgi:hypothetical protein
MRILNPCKIFREIEPSAGLLTHKLSLNFLLSLALQSAGTFSSASAKYLFTPSCHLFLPLSITCPQPLAHPSSHSRKLPNPLDLPSAHSVTPTHCVTLSNSLIHTYNHLACLVLQMPYFPSKIGYE